MEVYLSFGSCQSNNMNITNSNNPNTTPNSNTASTYNSSSAASTISNLTKQYLPSFCKTRKRVTFILDNCSVNKSYKTVACIVNLVECGMYDSVHLLFLFPNHGKFAADSIMGMFMAYFIPFVYVDSVKVVLP
jgi:hypothetical protein